MNNKLAITCLITSISLAPLMAMSSADADVDRAHPGTFVKDSAITTKIKTQLAAQHLTSSSIQVDTDANGIVLLSGTAVSQAEIDKAVAIARATDGVVTVKNELKVKSQS
jgi:hyperosmotically inducible protein